LQNRKEWELKGKEIVAEMLETVEKSTSCIQDEGEAAAAASSSSLAAASSANPVASTEREESAKENSAGTESVATKHTNNDE
jgi:hypothetical protein